MIIRKMAQNANFIALDAAPMSIFIAKLQGRRIKKQRLLSP